MHWEPWQRCIWAIPTRCSEGQQPLHCLSNMPINMVRCMGWSSTSSHNPLRRFLDLYLQHLVPQTSVLARIMFSKTFDRICLCTRILNGNNAEEQQLATQAEGIKSVEPLAPGAFQEELKHTLVCFVLVDKSASHGFCSRYDFGPWPLLPGVNSLTPTATQVSPWSLAHINSAHDLAALMQLHRPSIIGGRSDHLHCIFGRPIMPA